MITVVLDTNVVISGTYWDGESFKILRLLDEGKIACIASIEILKEYHRGLENPDILEKVDEYQVARRAGSIKLFQKMVILEPRIEIRRSRDPDDNKFIEAAIEGKAHYIVSKDNDLLEIEEYDGIPILSPQKFLQKTKGVL